ncbi:MAG: hypothetical protein NTW38_03115 [Candidatus Aminicenantes bacterium]|nr:hypothetical protein [Candidatus Aminicenantes bacterium]
METSTNFNRLSTRIKAAGILLFFVLSAAGTFDASPQVRPEALGPAKPTSVVKLIFVHHSTGENWLQDGYGNLGIELGANNYFTSDTNYGWGPNGIGDRTDIPDWREWFRGSNTAAIMKALYAESGRHSSYTRSLADPSGPNEIIMFKSCFPNSALEGNPNDPPDGSNPGLNVGYAKYVYNDLLKYFMTRPDKLFVVITAPPLSDNTYAANARAFNNWLVFDWLTQNAYAFNNVVVFDFYNILTDPNAHHRWYNNAIQHVAQTRNTLYYPASPGDDHPSIAGSRKAKTEFVPLLNVYYNRWKAVNVPVTRTYTSRGAEDGWVLESGENSSVGGTLNAGSLSLNVGDNAQKKQFRAFLSLDTHDIPDNAVFVSATLQVKRQGQVNQNPMEFANMLADVKKGAFGGSNSLVVADFQSPANLAPCCTFAETSVNGWYSAKLISGSLPFINKTGLTQFRVRFNVDDDNDSVADYLQFYSGEAASTNRPRLVITYIVP